jgi:hypothetical protein
MRRSDHQLAAAMAGSTIPRKSALIVLLFCVIEIAGCSPRDSYVDDYVIETASQPSGPVGIAFVDSTFDQVQNEHSTETLPQSALHRFSAVTMDSTVELSITDTVSRLYSSDRSTGQRDSISLPIIRRWSLRGRGGRVDTLPSRPIFLGVLHDSLALVVHESSRNSPQRSSRAFFASLINYLGFQVCLDLPLPEVRDRWFRLRISGDTLFATEQSNIVGRAASSDSRRVWRWHLRPRNCPWNFVQRDM